jgi:hypothetical protein
MAELPKDIRRPGGDMVPARSPFTRRVLLPTEADMCNALGITEEEYWQFVEQLEAKTKERPEAYDLIPDIRCDPITTFIAANIVTIGIAAGAAFVSYLLTPKPPSQKQGQAVRTEDIAGSKRFAPQNSFSSVQELAVLGDLIPLLFTKYQEIDRGLGPIAYGGIRVSSQILWSQLLSYGRYQRLKILALFSLGELGVKGDGPDFEGYAIGDLLISNYHSEKIYKVRTIDGHYLPGSETSIPFLSGEDKNENVFTDDVFKIDDGTGYFEQYFCGTRNPTTQSAFGLSSPMPNCTWFGLPYELIRWGDINKNTRAGIRIQVRKRVKNLGLWPMRAGFLDGGTDNQKLALDEVPVGTELTYQVVGGIDNNQTRADDTLAFQKNDTRHIGRHGVEDVNAISISVREATDGFISEGEQYMAGTALVTCIMGGDSREYPGAPWEGHKSKTRQYTFRVIQKGHYHCLSQPNLSTHCLNPEWNTSGNHWYVPNSNPNEFYYEQNKNQIFPPHSRYALQKTTIGSVSDNRNCDITEIGLKSKVFKQMQFANVNSKPAEGDIVSAIDNASPISLGQVQTYLNRISFFKLLVRKAGSDEEWSDNHWVKPNNVNNHSGLFCVKGNTPEFQYNYIRVEHPLGQYEYRFFPWPGNDVIKRVENGEYLKACLLNANGASDPDSVKSFTSGNLYTIRFAGVLEFGLTKQSLSNKEWNLGNPGVADTITYELIGVGTSTYQAQSSFGAGDIRSERQNTFIWTKFYGPQADSYPTPYTDTEDHHTLIKHFDIPGDPARWFNLYINRSDVTPNTEGRDGPEWSEKIGVFNAKALGATSHHDVRFEYTIAESGFKGYYEPILNDSLPGAGGNGHPGGKTDYYYVRKVEEQIRRVDPIVSKIIETSNVDDAGNEIAKGSGLTLKINVWEDPDPNYNPVGRDAIYAEWTIENRGDGEYRPGDKVRIAAVKYPGTNNVAVPTQIVSLDIDEVATRGELGNDIPSELNPYDVAADFWKYQGDRSSHLDGPEHQITYVNEIVKTTGSQRANYKDLAYAGLRIDSSKEWTNFTQFSAYFRKGIEVVKAPFTGSYKEETNLFPEIAYALLTDKKIGAGKVIPKESVNIVDMDIATKFCQANEFFWDGMITNRVNLRDFIFEQGTYCLLDFTIVGGQFSLYPSVPFKKDDHTIDHNALPEIKAMFTDGNIKDLQVNFLAPEDRQTFKANVLWRKEKLNGFAETKSIIYRLVGSDHDDDPIETYDFSGFCTSQNHAVNYIKYILSVREYTDHSINFKTAPHYVNGLKPGDYIRVFSTTNHTSRFNNGAILEDGTVVSKDTITGEHHMYYWNPSWKEDEQEVRETTTKLNFSNSNAVKAYAGTLFTIKETEKTDQCYKVESITFGEDGLIDLSASYVKLTDDGKLAILQGWFDDGSRFTLAE